MTAASSPPSRYTVIVPLGLVVLSAFPVWLWTWLNDGLPLWLVSGVAGGLLFGVAGIVAWRIDPVGRTGPWMIAFSVAQLARQIELPVGASGEVVLAIAQPTLVFLVYPIVAQLLLGFPHGRLPGRPERLMVGFAFALVCAVTVVVALTLTPVPWICIHCTRSPFAVVDDIAVHLTLMALVRAGVAAGCLWALALLVRQARSWTPYQRRGRALLLVAGSVGLLSGAAGQVLTVASYPRWISAEAPIWVQHVSLWAVGVGLPIALLLGLARERLAFRSVGDLLVALQDAPADRIGQFLANALRDPRLELAFPTRHGLVDVQGHPVEPGPNRAITPLGDPAIAVVVHDPGVAEHRALLDAAASATRLSLENARLHAEARASLAEMQDTRRRVVTAADEARRRVERDLHDGAQQRLLSVGLALNLLEQNLDEQAHATAVLDDARRHLLAAVRELRDLAAGIYPAVLTDQGLLPALAALAARSPTPVSVQGADPGRLPTEVETAAYFCASEGVANAIKHARATRIGIGLRRDGGILTLTVTDDCVGGADIDGHGIRGLADRLSAVDGRLTLDSPPSGGTTLTLELPCA